MRAVTDLTDKKPKPREKAVEVPVAAAEERKEEFKGHGLDIPLGDYAHVQHMLNFDFRKTGAYFTAQNLEEYFNEEIPKHEEPV